MKEASKLFFDTNVIIDALVSRNNKNYQSKDLIRRVASGHIKGYICSKQITDIYYVLRKEISSSQERKRIISVLLSIFEVLPLLKSELSYSLNLPFNDYEDAVLYEVAKINCIDAIITSNVKDFKNTDCVIYTPEQCWDLQNAIEPF